MKFKKEIIDQKLTSIEELVQDIRATVSAIEPEPDDLIRKDLLSARTFNCLRRAEITTLKELCNRTANDLLKIQNFGNKSLWEVKNMLDDYQLKLKQ